MMVEGVGVMDGLQIRCERGGVLGDIYSSSMGQI